MTGRAEHRQYEADYYADSSRKNQPHTGNLSAEDKADVRQGAQARTQKEASDYSVAQGDQLLQGQTTRGGAPVPGQNYAAASHDDLYQMVHNNVDLEGINNRGRVANDLGNWLADVSNSFNDAANAAEWQGNAASQAHGFFQATASHAEQTGQAVQLSSNRYSQQAAAAHYAQTNMPEPTGFNQHAEMDKATQQLVAGDPSGATQTMNGIAAKQQQADAAHAQAVQIMHGLDSTYHDTASTQPTYQSPPQPGHNESTSASGLHGGISTAGNFNVPGGTASGSGSLAPQTPPGSTPPPGSGGYQPPGISTGSGGPSTFGGNTFRPSPAGTSVPRLTPDGLALTGSPSGAPGTGDVTRSKPGAGRGFAGSRVSGGGTTAGPKGEAAEPGKGSAAGKGAERLARGGASASAAAAGKAGTAGAAGAQGKKKEEDKEHKNKLPNLEDDAFEVRPEYGPDGEKIIPPVIGG